MMFPAPSKARGSASSTAKRVPRNAMARLSIRLIRSSSKTPPAEGGHISATNQPSFVMPLKIRSGEASIRHRPAINSSKRKAQKSGVASRDFIMTYFPEPDGAVARKGDQSPQPLQGSGQESRRYPGIRIAVPQDRVLPRCRRRQQCQERWLRAH